MIEAHGLTRRYGDFTAVEGVSFTVPEGEICGILGPNGAGKTTTLRMITGFLPPTGGRVTIGGRDLFREPRTARREIGYLPENVALYTEMRVEELLRYRTRLQGMPRARTDDAIDAAIDHCLLGDVRRQIIRTLSKGYRQRVGLAAAILHGPGVLVLDEPTVGLDPKQIIAIRELIRELGRERTLLLSTHILPEVEQLCDRVLIIDRGRLVAEGSPGQLRARIAGGGRLRLLLRGTPDGAEAALAALPGVGPVRAAAEDGDSRFVLEHAAESDLRVAAFELAVAKGWTLLEMLEEKISLEDLFVRLTSRDAADAPTDTADAEESNP